MAVLLIPEQEKRVEDSVEIGFFLSERGILYQQWKAEIAFADDADQETILAAYNYVLQPYMESNGYQTVDVINITPDLLNLDTLAQKFLTEHIHTEDEVRFFVDGEGMFWFNQENESPVFCVLCQAGDLISVPANTKHWFDMGPKKKVKAIRIFIDQSGWVPHYTHSGIDAKYNNMKLGA
ncbi:MAG: 1,2-dihydroxy-3-keto-5-methylthiopentene dioxygenase [Saprospiraceae bacterium]|jgi:1,2-dihydroxy-3-keto-5-methylthiopentene dioxygenase